MRGPRHHAGSLRRPRVLYCFLVGSDEARQPHGFHSSRSRATRRGLSARPATLIRGCMERNTEKTWAWGQSRPLPSQIGRKPQKILGRFTRPGCMRQRDSQLLCSMRRRHVVFAAAPGASHSPRRHGPRGWHPLGLSFKWYRPVVKAVKLHGARHVTRPLKQ